MLYVDLNSFFAIDGARNDSFKQALLDAIESDIQEGTSQMDIEGDVYRLIINYNENKVEIWDWIMSNDEKQVPYRISFDDFIQALQEYIPRK